MSKGNGIDAKKAEDFVKRIEDRHAELDKLKSKHMTACKKVREETKEIYSEAKAEGLPKNALKRIVEYRQLERKQQDLADGLDIDEGAAYEQMLEKLGDFAGTALGQAALKKAKPSTAEASH